MRSKSSIDSSIPISCAMARRWSTALVEPPEAATLAMAFSMPVRVMSFDGRRSLRAAAMTSSPAVREAACLSGDVAGTPERSMGEIPRNSQAMAMVLAVNWPPQAPAPGQAEASSTSSAASSIWPRGVRADAFEYILDGDVDRLPVRAFHVAGCDGAAIEHERWNVETAERHDRARHVLVAAGDGDQAVEEIAASDELDGVGDDFAADQRGLHALRSHGDAVGDGDGVELHRRAAGCANAFLDCRSDIAQMEVAGADLRPGICDSYDRLVQVFLREADAAQVGACRCAVRAFGERDAVLLGIARSVGRSLLLMIYLYLLLLRSQSRLRAA